MTIFLPNLSQIQLIESRLQQNQYLSNECLPNFVDAQVFIALKTSNHIPKRQTFPHFYHWYILMRQFAQRTLEYWLKESHTKETDHIIKELISILQGNKNQDGQSLLNKSLERPLIDSKIHQNPITKDPEGKENRNESIPLQTVDNRQTKVIFSIDKKDLNEGDSLTEYLMSIKMSCWTGAELEQIKKQFEVQNVKGKFVRVAKELSSKGNELYLWLQFETSKSRCEQLKNTILRFSNVQNIQCKKIRRTQC